MRGILNILEDSAAVGAICGDRIYVNKIPEGVDKLPCVWIERQGRPFVGYTSSGASDLDMIDHRVVSTATTALEADSLGDAVRAALEAKAAGVYDTETFAGVDFIDDDTSVFSASDKNIHLVEQIYTVWKRL